MIIANPTWRPWPFGATNPTTHGSKPEPLGQRLLFQACGIQFLREGVPQFVRYKENVEKMSALLLNAKKPGVQFEDKWHELKPTVNKLLKQQAVTTQEWQNLFW